MKRGDRCYTVSGKHWHRFKGGGFGWEIERTLCGYIATLSPLLTPLEPCRTCERLWQKEQKGE